MPSHPVKELQHVVLSVLRSNPPHLLVSAHGLVGSTGWGDPVLVPRGAPGSDGLLELDFVAAPRPGVTLAEVDLPVHAAYLHEGELAAVRTIIVHAQLNKIELPRSAARDLATAPTVAPPYPVSVKKLPQTVRDLLGLRLRLLRPGERAPSTDYDPERVTIHVDEAGVISNITFG